MALEIKPVTSAGTLQQTQSGTMEDRRMSLALKLGLIYLVSEFLLTLTPRSCSKMGTKQDRSTLGIIWLVIANVLPCQAMKAAIVVLPG